ncbi:MAG: hypothetical protein IJM18_10325 [Clostridia bacterium]|nr:hypothetical protein [Clostridia bacterium]
MKKRGWSDREDELLITLCEEAKRASAPLSPVFRKAGAMLGRKPDSVRNRYYALLKQAGVRAASYTPFTPEETEELIMLFMKGARSGRSVRRIAFDAAHGDAGLMLRYQNKFRAVIRKDPDLIRSVAERHGFEAECAELLDGKYEKKPAPNDDIAVELKRKNEELKLAHERFMRQSVLFSRLYSIALGYIERYGGLEAKKAEADIRSIKAQLKL